MLDGSQWYSFAYMTVVLLVLIFVAPNFTGRFIQFLLSYRCRKEKQELKAQAAEYRKELSKVNQMDEFAKYSKIQRKLKQTTGALSTFSKVDLELYVKLNLVAQLIVWLLVAVLSVKTTYQFYALAKMQLGFA